MTIEEKIFARKRFLTESLPSFGFSACGGGWRLEHELLGGEFTARILVSDAGRVSGMVIDRMNDEEYAPLRAEGYNGSYVAGVRAAYEELLSRIARSCCRDVLFSTEQANRLTADIEEQLGVLPDFPFSGEEYAPSGVFRHTDSRKWFGLIMNVRRGLLTGETSSAKTDVINLKTDPRYSEETSSLPGVFPAYHMNHRNWISVLLDDALDDHTVMALVKRSFELTDAKNKSKRRTRNA